MYCQHQPQCPQAEAVDHDAARIVASHPEQGWNLLCNGVIVFEDTGELMPDGRSVSRTAARRALSTASRLSSTP